MAALQTALQALSPADFTSVPSASEELDTYLSGIFEQTQLILDSIPIAVPGDDANQRPRSYTASNASEMLQSAARSAPPPPDRQALQKEWGKPIKLGQKENPLGISVYKTSGKDGRGSWFARRSVHEGLGFDRFKRAFEKEFPTSLAVVGAPGEGNIRGIGAERRVEDIAASNHARVQVYQLSAQFPGPTTPRDFVTLLITSAKALKPHADDELVPRHYMIVSKPCDHPETQPRDGFIRGQYESVEFIREIPRRLKASTSSTDLTQLSHKHEHSREKDAAHLHPDSLDASSDTKSRDASPGARKRSRTVGDPTLHSAGRPSMDEYDPEENPIEWIMVTRSDPGGSVPRFLVDRGTPSSICADAVKFLDWACSLDETSAEIPDTPVKPPVAFRRESFTSFAGKERFPDIEESEESMQVPNTAVPQTMLTQPTPITPTAPQGAGLFASVAGAFSSYAPQAVLDHLPGGQTTTGTATQVQKETAADDFDDASSISSSLSFASADSHLSRQLSPQSTTASLVTQSSNLGKPQNPHEKELAKLAQKRAALEAKHAATKAKLESQNTNSTEKEAAALKKAEEKHEKELKKQEDRYKRELEKIEQRRQREERKAEQRKKRAGEKDEKEKLRRERDELKEKVEVLQREAEVWQRQVGELQRENTRLVAKVGKLEGSPAVSAAASKDGLSANGETLSRSSTPTPGSTAGGASLASSGIGQEKRNPSEENLKRLGSRVRTLTFNSLGMSDRLKQEASVESGDGNRSRSNSLFRRRKEAEVGGEGASEKASMKSQGSTTS